MSISVAPAVADALAKGEPVVALESTIIAHGFPRPRNLALALELESVVAKAGARPATIGVLDGRLIVGLDSDELVRIATDDVAKLNASNMAMALADGSSGATTVSATLRAARLAGIGVMATGGIGGVHRGASHDISADLPEMASSPIGVVSSGAKAFLDLAATLDYLETLGVAVVGYRTSDFPAFYSTSSGLALSNTVDSPTAAAAVIGAARELGDAGVLVANPVPIDSAIARDEVESWTAEATAQADEAGITGLERSPFVLGRLVDISGGRVVETNAALAESNAKLAAEIALEL